MSASLNEDDSVAQYGNHLSSNKFVFVVFYRGHWCPFCQSYLRTLETLSPAITAAGGKVIAVTSETADHLQQTRDTTGYTGEVIVDPQNRLAAELRRRGRINVAISDKKGYINGMAQPAVLVTQSDGTIFESWAIVPSTMNLGGAKDRPDLSQVWENVEAQIKGQPKIYQNYKLQTFFGVMLKKLFG